MVYSDVLVLNMCLIVGNSKLIRPYDHDN